MAPNEDALEIEMRKVNNLPNCNDPLGITRGEGFPLDLDFGGQPSSIFDELTIMPPTGTWADGEPEVNEVVAIADSLANPGASITITTAAPHGWVARNVVCLRGPNFAALNYEIKDRIELVPAPNQFDVPGVFTVTATGSVERPMSSKCSENHEDLSGFFFPSAPVAGALTIQPWFGKEYIGYAPGADLVNIPNTIMPMWFEFAKRLGSERVIMVPVGVIPPGLAYDLFLFHTRDPF